MQERRKDQDDFVLPENVLEEGNEIPRDRPGRLRRERREPDEPVKKTSRIFRIVAFTVTGSPRTETSVSPSRSRRPSVPSAW